MTDHSAPKKRSRKPAPNILAAEPATAAPQPFVAADALPVASAVALAAPFEEQAALPVIELPAEATSPAADVPMPTLEPTIEIASAVAEPLQEGPAPMATTYDATATTEAAADKAKALFGDFNDRAKGAMEKSVKLGEEMTEFTKGNVEALVASGRVAAKGAETLAQDVAETMKKNFETTTATFKSFASVKSPTELFQLQSDYAKSYFDGAVADVSKYSEAMMKLMGDIAQPLSSRYALAAEKFKASAL